MLSETNLNVNFINWDVSKVFDMFNMFNDCKFSGDISNWSVYALESVDYIFNSKTFNIPYWSMIQNQEQRIQAIDKFKLKGELKEELEINDGNLGKRVKI
jgi:hypothetical protein